MIDSILYCNFLETILSRMDDSIEANKKYEI